MPTAKRVYTGTLVHTVAYSLKFPEASRLQNDVATSIAHVQRSKHKLRVLILDMAAVEYVDFSGVQALFAVKDLLAKVANGNGDIQMHFANACTAHMNRLLRVVWYSPASPQAAVEKPVLKPAQSLQLLPAAPPPPQLDRAQSPVDSEVSYEDVFGARTRTPMVSRRNSEKENGSAQNAAGPRGRRPSLKEVVAAIGRSLSIGTKSGGARRSLPVNHRAAAAAVPETKKRAFSLKPSRSNVSLASAQADGLTKGPNPENAKALEHFHATVEEALLNIASRSC
ncbi:hypothetical protein HDU83_006017 [Entophlyctis luteolus]|nr:hypothetical protein HDU83_006017 [Entophlyctis luteolus]KAJ3392100.1 hypothetical protein HDU84_004809 [Entophlyctis sp. JEL0112]